MSPIKSNAHIIKHPFADLMQGARLDSFEKNGNEVRITVQGFDVVASELFEQDGVIMERVTGRHIPLDITFSNVYQMKENEFFSNLEQYALDDPSRTIGFMHSWIMPGMDDIFHMLSLVKAGTNFFASGVTHTQGEAGESFTIERDWSPSPPMPEGDVPQPYDIYDRFGGDPVIFNIDGKTVENKLFVGGIENQSNVRPTEIHTVLNLGEKPSAWVKENQPQSPNDRAVEKGEGSKGMTPEEIRTEANWVIDHLKKDESVLIHCVAGMNRSTTVTCAVLMQLEGLTAEQAIQRVYENHPWSKPDSHHWLMLKWLEKTNTSKKPEI